MSKFKKFISNIIDETSIRDNVIVTEIDDFYNPMHIVRLKEVLQEYGDDIHDI